MPTIAAAQYEISFFSNLGTGCVASTNYASCGDIAENVCCLASFTESPEHVQGSNLDTTGVPDIVRFQSVTGIVQSHILTRPSRLLRISLVSQVLPAAMKVVTPVAVMPLNV